MPATEEVHKVVGILQESKESHRKDKREAETVLTYVDLYGLKGLSAKGVSLVGDALELLIAEKEESISVLEDSIRELSS